MTARDGPGGREVMAGDDGTAAGEQRSARHGACDPVVADIAARLDETAPGPLWQLARAVATLGEARVRAFVDEALAVEARGGLLLPDGSQRRTLGGVFFYLMRKGITPAERRAIFPPRRRLTTPERGPAFVWEDFPAALAELRERGEATRVKITIIGRPGSVAERGPVVLLAVTSERVPSLPKGLPAPSGPTEYALVVARKQWERVAAALRRTDDQLIVEGYPTFDPRFRGITVLATHVTTRLQQQAERQQRLARAEQAH